MLTTEMKFEGVRLMTSEDSSAAEAKPAAAKRAARGASDDKRIFMGGRGVKVV